MRRLAAFLFLSTLPIYAGDWGRAITGQDSAGHWYAILENQLVRCRYSWKPINQDKGGESFITELLIKANNLNQAATSIDSGRGRIDACAHRFNLTEAEVVYSGPDRKTIALKWHHRDTAMVPQQTVTILPGVPAVKVDYQVYGVNIVDIANPGEGAHPQYAFWGGDKWKRGFLLYPKGYYYPKADTFVTRITGMPGDDDPGPLEYKGHFIMSVFNKETGVGYGRVISSKAANIIKLLHNQGFEIFPYWKQSKKPFTGYLFIFTGGQKEAMKLGKRLVDMELKSGKDDAS